MQQIQQSAAKELLIDEILDDFSYQDTNNYFTAKTDEYNNYYDQIEDEEESATLTNCLVANYVFFIIVGNIKCYSFCLYMFLSF